MRFESLILPGYYPWRYLQLKDSGFDSDAG